MLRQHELQIRVRYRETDPMGVVHHANYFTYFELGRTEMLREAGVSYRQMEEEGLLIVVAKAQCRYLRPARYDDVLTVRTTIKRVTAAKIEHEYELLRDSQQLALGQITLAVVDRQGKICRVPEWMQLDE